MQIAVSVFSRFLLEHEIEIILVVFDKKSFQLSEKIVGEIDSYIDANHVKKQRITEYYRRSVRALREVEPECEETNLLSMLEPIMQAPMRSLEEKLDNIGMSFHDKLFELIDRAGLDNKDVWKQANLDRKHFSKHNVV